MSRTGTPLPATGWPTVRTCARSTTTRADAERLVRIDEGLMDAFTAVASSGLAYVFYLAEGMMKAAVELGFDAATADRMVRETITGAAGLMSWKTIKSSSS